MANYYPKLNKTRNAPNKIKRKADKPKGVGPIKNTQSTHPDDRLAYAMKRIDLERGLSEMSPPGFGATKGDDKGGTAAAFDRARKEGRFKGSKSDMFAIMWSQKNKGDKPHYKPGTDKKYKKYQEGMENAPSIKDKDAPHKKIKKTNVKNYPGLGYAPTINERLDDLLSDPLEELYNLYEAELNVMPKPPMQDELPSGYESPHKGQYEHPVTKMRNEIDSLIAQGMDPTMAHQSVHGDINPGDIESKAKLASTLGRIQDDGNTNAVKMEPEKQSLLYKDAQYSKQIDAVTHDDLRTPMNQQVPDDQQTPADQVAEDIQECYNYMDDVKYLQTYGRA